MTVRGVKLKSKSFFSISYGFLELRGKTLRDGAEGFRPPHGMNTFEHFETESGFCINTIHPAEFVLKSEENSLLHQILSKI